MNDNDIIKALECCSMSKVRYDNALKCSKCPAYYDERCTAKPKEVLDFINRLQAEIERLKIKIEDLESMQEISPEAKYLVDTKADKVISLLNEINKSQGQIKSDARKEFAERLCEGRVSNDPVVIAVKTELEMMDGKENV